MYLYNVVGQLLLAGKNLEVGAAKVAIGTKGNFTIMPFSTTRLSCISSSSLIFPSISSSLPSSSFFSSPSCSFSPYFMGFGRHPGPPSSPAGTCRTGTGMSAYRPGPPSPRFQNNDRFEIIHKLPNCDKNYNILIFRGLSS